MKRRSLLKALFVLPLAASVEQPPILFAHVHKTPWLVGKVRVRLNCREVADCIWADVCSGRCEIYLRDHQGSKFAINGKMATRILRGSVRIERKA